MNIQFSKVTVVIATLCCFAITNLAAESNRPAIKPRAAATITPDSHWSNGQAENDHNFVCPPKDTGTSSVVLVGRKHEGDENEDTFYKCARVTQFDQLTNLIEHESWENNQEDGNYVECSTDKVMIGRSHYGDENDHEWISCAALTDSWGNKMQVISDDWSSAMDEHDHEFECPTGKVLTGRYHEGDEEGDTKYRCGSLW